MGTYQRYRLKVSDNILIRRLTTYQVDVLFIPFCNWILLLPSPSCATATTEALTLRRIKFHQDKVSGLPWSASSSIPPSPSFIHLSRLEFAAVVWALIKINLRHPTTAILTLKTYNSFSEKLVKNPLGSQSSMPDWNVFFYKAKRSDYTVYDKKKKKKRQL